MAFHDNPGNDFGKQNFPSIDGSANEETGKAELYPKRLQDDINEIYQHNKVLPRIEGVDYEKDKEMNEGGAETKSTFPYRY